MRRHAKTRITGAEWEWGRMGDYYAPARGTMEIMRPEGHIMQPEGGIMFPEGLYDFHWPEGRAQ